MSDLKGLGLSQRQKDIKQTGTKKCQKWQRLFLNDFNIEYKQKGYSKKMGRLMGLEPTTTEITTRGSTN